MTDWSPSAASSSTANGCLISTRSRESSPKSYDVNPDGLKITFHLRKDAKFQDGTPVTADDVKWSLDRVVTAPVLGKAQLLTGSMTSADQFKVIDPLTFEVTLPKPDKLALPNLATVYPIIINSKLAKDHATADDPWATAWLKEHAAGSGAYQIETFKPGEQVIIARNEAWNRGSADKPAFFKKVIVPVGAGTGDPRQPGRTWRRRSRHRLAGE